MSGRVLEVGAGSARFLRAICSRLPEWEGHACDMSRTGLEVALRRDGHLAVAQADLTALPYAAETFDAVVLFDVLEHLHRPGEAVEEIVRVLKTGGILHGLVPCEGEPATLHWAMWKAGLAADLKERSVGHVQRFTHGDLKRLLVQEGLEITDASYSMHWTGQVKDVFMHAEQGHRLSPLVTRHPLFRAAMAGLWASSYLESNILSRSPLSAVALHITAVKGVVGRLHSAREHALPTRAGA